MRAAFGPETYVGFAAVRELRRPRSARLRAHAELVPASNELVPGCRHRAHVGRLSRRRFQAIERQLKFRADSAACCNESRTPDERQPVWSFEVSFTAEIRRLRVSYNIRGVPVHRLGCIDELATVAHHAAVRVLPHEMTAPRSCGAPTGAGVPSMAQGIVPMRASLPPAAVVVLAAAAACHTPPSGFADLVNRPQPTSDAERNHECQWIRSERARQRQSFRQVGSGGDQSMARANIAYLDSRYFQYQCAVLPGVDPTEPVLKMPPRSSGNNVFPGVEPTEPVLRMPHQSSPPLED